MITIPTAGSNARAERYFARNEWMLFAESGATASLACAVLEAHASQANARKRAITSEVTGKEKNTANASPKVHPASLGIIVPHLVFVSYV
ncbi:hypothetical protein DXT68_00305 [Microbacterium foliorum]|nr:hypothetical protein DXT68_00305 [Microbacterium foliorum]